MGDEDEYDEVRRMINRMLSDAVEGKVGHDSEPYVRGFAGRTGTRSGGKPVVRYLVQVPPDPAPPAPDVVATGDAVFVTFDLGGRAPEAVRTRSSGRLALIEVTGAKAMQRVIELPFEVESEGSWTVRDGVLDLTLRRRRPAAIPS